MTFSRFLILLAAGGSAALLLGAFGFQYIGELAPCKLRIWQRYPHALAVLIGVAAVAIRGRLLPLLGLFFCLKRVLRGPSCFHLMDFRVCFCEDSKRLVERRGKIVCLIR